MAGPSGKAPYETGVLIVEDEPSLRDVLASAVRDMGFRSMTARSGEEAVRLMERNPAEILLVDLNLPGMGGMELFEYVFGRWPAVSVIILTGYGDLEAAKHAIHLNVVDFLTKPAPLGDLEKALHRAWSRTVKDPMSVAAPAVRAPDPPVPAGERVQTLEELEREQILAALERHNGNRAAAAAELGISVRTLYYRLAAYEQRGETRPEP